VSAHDMACNAQFKLENPVFACAGPCSSLQLHQNHIYNDWKNLSALQAPSVHCRFHPIAFSPLHLPSILGFLSTVMNAKHRNGCQKDGTHGYFSFLFSPSYGWLAGRTSCFFYLHIVKLGPERTGHSLIIYFLFVSAPSGPFSFSFVAVFVCTFVPTGT
jgi:hypothetical protein